jgi:hypothetical protein
MEHARGLLLLTLLAALTLCGVTESYAAWDLVPELSITAGSDDNLRLLPDEAPDLGNSGMTMLDAQFTVSSTGNRGNVFFEPRIRAESYSNTADEVFDGQDAFAHLRGERRLQSGSLGFRVDFDRQDVKDAELTEATPEDPDVDTPIDPDTGRLLFVNQDRERLYVSPYAEFALSERSSVLLEAQLLGVTYSEIELSGRVDFENHLFAAGLVRRVDERNEVSARVVVQQYEADYNQNKTDTVGVEGRFSRPLARGAWSFELNTGVSRSDFTYLNSQDQLVDNADTSFTYGLRFRNRTDRNSFNIDVLRQTNPNAGGYLYLRDEIRVYMRRAMSERLTGGIGLRAYSSETLDDFAQSDERDYARLELEMEWAIAPRVFLSGGYAFTSQEFADVTAVKAESNSIFLGITYRGLTQP